MNVSVKVLIYMCEMEPTQFMLHPFQHPQPWIGLPGVEKMWLMDGYSVLIFFSGRKCDFPSYSLQKHSFIHSFSLPAYSYSRSQSISKQVVGGKKQNTLDSLPICDFYLIVIYMTAPNSGFPPLKSTFCLWWECFTSSIRKETN